MKNKKNWIFLDVFLLNVLKSIRDINLSILQNCVNKKAGLLVDAKQ